MRSSTEQLTVILTTMASVEKSCTITGAFVAGRVREPHVMLKEAQWLAIGC